MGRDDAAQGGFELGLSRVLEFKVTTADTALRQGSGDLGVLATPRLIAWMEAATCAVANAVLDPAHTSVGVRVEVEHVAPSPVHARVVTTAVVTERDTNFVKFSVIGVDAGTGRVVARGTITRVVVDRVRFMAQFDH